MARRSARILAKARKHMASSPNSSHMFSGTGNSSLEQFPLMELPREIRDMIYEACLVPDGAIFVRDVKIGRAPSSPWRRPREDFDRQMSSIESSATAQILNLLYVSKQIRDEALPIFYRKNTFEFTSLTEMEGFIRSMRMRNRHNLRSVIVYYEGLEYERPLRLLARCVGLRDLTLVLCDACVRYALNYTGFDWVELHELRAFETLLRIRGLDNVRLVLSRRAGHLVTRTSNRSFERLSAMEAAVQVTKQPRPVPQKRMKPNKVKKRAQKKRKSASI